jgi:hypothetical protein
MSETVPIMVADLCRKHLSELINRAGYKETDPWRSLVIMAQIALFQAATADAKTHELIGDDISKIGTLGCLACYKPDAFEEIVDAAKTKEPRAIKELGESFLKRKQ